MVQGINFFFLQGENNLIEEQSEIVNLDPELEGEPQGDGSGPVPVMIIGNNNVFEVPVQ
jgi:hypothetical protein